jgi:hypothetical protein
MALSGTFSNKWKGYTYQISWSATQNTSGNYSTITCTHKLICDSTWALYIDGRTITCTVNSVNKTVYTSGVSTGGGTTIVLGTTTHTVTHSSNGTGSFSLSSVYPIQATIQGTYQASISVSGSATLNTIPRASSMSFNEFTMGTAGTITVNKASSGFTHTITYAFGSKSGTIVSKTSNTSASWTPAVNELAGQIPDSTRGVGTLTLITYSGNTEVGRNAYTFYCNVPSNVVPTVGTITLTPDTISGNKILIQNKNKLTIDVTGSSAGTGSSIKSYTFSGTGISTTTTSSSVSINSISDSGTLTYTVTVTDSRGRTASKNATITCYSYVAPVFTKFEAYRDNNNNIKCDYEVSYSSVNSTNKITIRFAYMDAHGNATPIDDTLSDSSKTGHIILTNAADEVCIIYATVTDSYGAFVTSTTRTVFGSARVLNLAPWGNGVSFGRKSSITSESDAGKFEVGWDATFDKNVNISGDVAASGNINGVVINKNTYIKGGAETVNSHEWVDSSPSFIGTYTINNAWYNVISVRHRNGEGDGPNYGMELRSNLTNDDSLSWRQQTNATWKNWKTLLDTGNTADFVIEQGASGEWTIRKWNNGTCECWRKITGTITSNGTWNNMKTFSGSADWPSNFFIENPNVQYQVYIGNGYAFPARGVLSTTTKFIWNALGSDGDPNIGYVVDVYAVGRWK